MCLEHFADLLNWNVLRFGQEEEDEESHYDDKPTKEEEETEFHVAEHSKEGLADEEGEEHVHWDIDGLPGRSDLQGEDLTGY